MRKFEIFIEPQKLCLRICIVYIFILLGEIGKKDFILGDQKEFTTVSVQY